MVDLNEFLVVPNSFELFLAENAGEETPFIYINVFSDSVKTPGSI